MYLFSLILIVISNIFYHNAQKFTHEKTNPFGSLLVSYLIAALLTGLALIILRSKESVMQSFRQLNCTSLLLGFSIVSLELGFLMAYRAGWNISVGALVLYIVLALALIPVGMFFYQEDFSLNKLLGVLLCIGGLVLINLK